MRILSLVIAAVLLWGAAAQASDEPVTGAKELFYDPAGGGISAGPPAKSLPKHPGGHTSAAPVRSPGRRSIQRTASPGGQKTLGLSYWIELADPKGGPGTQVTDRRTFHSGEGIRLHFRSNTDGQIALLQLGSSGDASLLFPDPEHGLGDADLAADQDRVLPSDSHWFRFDDHPGTERLLVLFARHREDLETLSVRPIMDSKTTQAVLKIAGGLRGSKDLIVETETQSASEVGTYGVTLSGKPVILEIMLKHE